MTQRENESIDASARAKLGEDRSVSERIRTADTVARLVKLLLGLVVAATLGLAGIWYAQADTKRRLDEFDKLRHDRDIQMEGLKTRNDDQDKLSESQRVAQDKLIDAQRVRMDELRKDFDGLAERVKHIEPLVNYMESLRRFGISNKEDFVREHGYAAPSNPNAEPTPTPRQAK